MATAVTRKADFREVPSMEIDELGSGSRGEAAVIAAIRHASENVGSFYAAKHGVELALVEPALNESRRLFGKSIS